MTLVFSTGNKSFLILASFKEFFSRASLLVKITEDFSKEVPKDERLSGDFEKVMKAEVRKKSQEEIQEIHQANKQILIEKGLL